MEQFYWKKAGNPCKTRNRNGIKPVRTHAHNAQLPKLENIYLERHLLLARPSRVGLPDSCISPEPLPEVHRRRPVECTNLRPLPRSPVQAPSLHPSMREWAYRPQG